MSYSDMARECKKAAQEAVQKINEYADGIHAGSTEGISTNSGGLDELGQMMSDIVESVDELGATLSTLEERISALEGGKA